MNSHEAVLVATVQCNIAHQFVEANWFRLYFLFSLILGIFFLAPESNVDKTE